VSFQKALTVAAAIPGTERYFDVGNALKRGLKLVRSFELSSMMQGIWDEVYITSEMQELLT
jgi:hypothetical protein